MTNKKQLKQDVFRLLQGAIVGGGAILPGVSGGVLCAAFGLYMPLMQLASHPFRELKRNLRLWVLVLSGFALGFIGFAFGVTALLKASSSIAMALFAGLIFGTLPALFKEAHSGEGINAKEPPKKHGNARFFAMCISFVLSMTLFVFIAMSKSSSVAIVPNFWWFGFCGILWGLSFVIPGMTSSSILMLLGLYEPMSSGIASLDFNVILPMGCGILLIILTLSRVMNRIFSHFYTEAYYAVIGVVISSTLVIIPIKHESVLSFISCLAVLLLGGFASYFADKKLRKE